MNSNLNHYTTDQLFPLVQEGNDIAYAIFCKKVYNMLWLGAKYKTRDDDEAKDIIQDIYFWIWINRDQLGTINNINAYLLKMLDNRAADNFRSKAARKKREMIYSMSRETVSEDCPIEIKELGEDLRRAINAISPVCREAFIKSYLENKSHKVIAIEMAINVQSVRNNISRALKSLRIQLKKNSI